VAQIYKARKVAFYSVNRNRRLRLNPSARVVTGLHLNQRFVDSSFYLCARNQSVSLLNDVQFENQLSHTLSPGRNEQLNTIRNENHVI